MYCTLIFLVACIDGFSQEITHRHAIAHLKQNVAYIGVANPLAAVVEGYMCDGIIVTTDNGKLEVGENGCSYVLYPHSPGIATITIVAKGKPNKVLGSSKFRVKHIPAPDAIVGGLNGEKIKKNVLRAQIGIIAELIGFDFDIRYMITEYTVTILSKESYFTESCTDPRFPMEVKQAFDHVKTNDVVVFSNIKCKSPNGRIQDLRPIEFVVVD